MLHRRDLEALLEEIVEEVPVRKLFISNLAGRTNNKDLEKLFSAYGKVESCYLKRIDDRSNFAFVTFSNSADALKARRAACKMMIQLHCRILRVSPADSWHQPDSPENCRKFKNISENLCDDRPQEEGNDEDTPIHMLNDDCLMGIFVYLPIADRIRMERVCKRWQATSLKSWKAVKRLDLSSSSWGLTPRLRKQYVDTPALRKVLLKCGNFLNYIEFSQAHLLGPSTLTIVGKFCPNLRTIDTSLVILSQAGIRSLLQSSDNVTRFVMRGLTGPCERDLSQLFAAYKKLEALKILNASHLTGKCLLQLPHTMEEIDLDVGITIAANHMEAALKKCMLLRKLSLSSCVCLIDSTFQVIGTIKSLTSLKLGDFPLVSAAAIHHIAELVNLESLTMRRNSLATDTLMHLLATNCKRLNHLDIYGSTLVTNEGLASLSTLPNLHHLVISYATSITDKGLLGMRNLKTLECHGCLALEDPGVSSLIETAPNLATLDLSSCLITNATIEVALRATRRRDNNVILKMIVGNTPTNLSEITEVSPLLQIINVRLDRKADKPSWYCAPAGRQFFMQWLNPGAYRDIPFA